VFLYRLNFLFIVKFKLTIPLLCLCAFCLKKPSPKLPILCWVGH